MNSATLEKNFAKIGARVEVKEPTTNRGFRLPNIPNTRVSVKVEGTGRNEHFVLEVGKDFKGEIHALDVQPQDRHMILQIVHNPGDKSRMALAPEKFLVGHDEMHFFAASVGRTVTKVRDAKEHLMPTRIRDHVLKVDLRKKDKFKRHNDAFLRQGEWFFIPRKNMTVDKKYILYNEPLIRNRQSKPHTMSECYRIGGTAVWVWLNRVLTETQFGQLHKTNPEDSKKYRQMIRNPQVFCRGKIKHVDHHTLDFGNVWHEVVMNSEFRSASLGFLD